jgi:hypothetical protein
MTRYMPHLNKENRENFDIEWAEHQNYLEFTRLEGIRKMAEQQSELMDNLKARIAEQQTKDEALAESLILTPGNTPQSILSLQIIHSLPEHSQSQSSPSISLTEHSLPQTSPFSSRSSQSIPQSISTPQTNHGTGSPGAERTLGTANLARNFSKSRKKEGR